MTSPISSAFRTMLISRQAAGLPPRRRSEASTGRSADDRAPPAIRVKRMSGRRLVASKAPVISVAPNCAPSRTCRTAPRMAEGEKGRHQQERRAPDAELSPAQCARSQRRPADGQAGQHRRHGPDRSAPSGTEAAPGWFLPWRLGRPGRLGGVVGAGRCHSTGCIVSGPGRCQSPERPPCFSSTRIAPISMPRSTALTMS